MLRVMSKSESTQHPPGSATDAHVAEEAVHELVIEQRTPFARNLVPSEHRRTGALASLLARGSQEGTEVHAAMEDLDTIADERVHRAFTPVVAAIEARFDVQDAKIDAQNVKIDAQNVRIDAQNVKIESLTEAVRELTGTVAATNAKVESLTATVGDLTKEVAATNAKVESLTATVAAINAKVEAQNAKIGALYWMFGTLIALFMALVALGVYNHLFPPPSIASGNSGPAPQTTSGEPPEPPSEAGSVTPAPAATSVEPTQDRDEP